MQPHDSPAVRICDCCDAEWWGASKRDVLDHGWKFHDAKRGRTLLVCGDCQRRVCPRRLAPAPFSGPHCTLCAA